MFGFISLPRPLRARAAALPAAMVQPAAAAQEPVEDDAGRTSWFESSLDLREGLEVTEFASLGPVANDLPVSWWLH
jgi:hypothetical protein